MTGVQTCALPIWNADAAKPAVYNNNAALHLYNCAYGSGGVENDNGTFTDGDGSCITDLDWSGRASVKRTADGVEHTVFMLESGKDGELINGGLVAGDVKTKLGLAEKPDLTKDQLGSARGDEPSIGAVEPLSNNSTGHSGCDSGFGALALLAVIAAPFRKH